MAVAIKYIDVMQADYILINILPASDQSGGAVIKIERSHRVA